MTRKIIHTDRAPKAIGPYSQAVAAGGMVFLSGQVGLDPKTGEIVAGGLEAEARRDSRTSPRSPRPRVRASPLPRG